LSPHRGLISDHLAPLTAFAAMGGPGPTSEHVAPSRSHRCVKGSSISEPDQLWCGAAFFVSTVSTDRLLDPGRSYCTSAVCVLMNNSGLTWFGTVLGCSTFIQHKSTPLFGLARLQVPQDRNNLLTLVNVCSRYGATRLFPRCASVVTTARRLPTHTHLLGCNRGLHTLWSPRHGLPLLWVPLPCRFIQEFVLRRRHLACCVVSMPGLPLRLCNSSPVSLKTVWLHVLPLLGLYPSPIRPGGGFSTRYYDCFPHQHVRVGTAVWGTPPNGISLLGCQDRGSESSRVVGVCFIGNP